MGEPGGGGGHDLDLPNPILSKVIWQPEDNQPEISGEFGISSMQGGVFNYIMLLTNWAALFGS